MLNMTVGNSTTVDKTVENFTAVMNDIISPFCMQMFNKHSYESIIIYTQVGLFS